MLFFRATEASNAVVTFKIPTGKYQRQLHQP